MPPNPLALSLFRRDATYLLARGWSRDGDDEGAWRDGGGLNPPSMSFGDAFQTQLERDGVNMQTPVRARGDAA